MTYRKLLYLKLKLMTFHLDLILSDFWLESIFFEIRSYEVVSFFLAQTLDSDYKPIYSIQSLFLICSGFFYFHQTDKDFCFSQQFHKEKWQKVSQSEGKILLLQQKLFSYSEGKILLLSKSFFPFAKGFFLQSRKKVFAKTQNLVIWREIK